MWYVFPNNSAKPVQVRMVYLQEPPLSIGIFRWLDSSPEVARRGTKWASNCYLRLADCILFTAARN